jgi:hypothetical protein
MIDCKLLINWRLSDFSLKICEVEYFFSPFDYIYLALALLSLKKNVYKIITLDVNCQDKMP